MTTTDVSTAAAEHRMDALSALLARNWWAVALRGVAAIVFGLVAFFATGATILSLLIVFAALMLADGVLNLVAGIRSARRRERWGVVILQGIASLVAAGVAAIVFGLVAFFATGATILSLLIVFAALMLADGVLNLVAGIRSARRRARWGVLILQGIASLIAAGVAVLLPGLTMIAFVYLIAAWAVVSGVLSVVAAIRLRGDHGRWWMGLGGALSIVAGVLLAIAPLLGALVLTWWLGAYAIVFGVTLLVLAYRLRSQRSTDDLHHDATPHPA